MRIFGTDTVVTPNFSQTNADFNYRSTEDEVDILVQMQEKPATPIMRQRTLEATRTMNQPLDDIMEEESMGLTTKGNTTTDEEFKAANQKFGGHHEVEGARSSIKEDCRSDLDEDDEREETSRSDRHREAERMRLEHE